MPETLRDRIQDATSDTDKPSPHPIVIPNLIRAILNFADDPTLTTSLLVSRLFFSIASDVLYNALNIHMEPSISDLGEPRTILYGLGADSYDRWIHKEPGWELTKWALLQKVKLAKFSFDEAAYNEHDYPDVVVWRRVLSPSTTLRFNIGFQHCCWREADLMFRMILHLAVPSTGRVIIDLRQDANLHTTMTSATSSDVSTSGLTLIVNPFLGYWTALGTWISKLGIEEHAIRPQRIIMAASSYPYKKGWGRGETDAWYLWYLLVDSTLKTQCKIYVVDGIDADSADHGEEENHGRLECATTEEIADRMKGPISADQLADHTRHIFERLYKSNYRKGEIVILDRRDYLKDVIRDELNEEDIERLRKDQALEDAKTPAAAERK